MSELDDLLKLHKTDDRMITHRELHKIANLARAEVERLRAVIDAYASIEVAHRLGMRPIERYLDCVREYQATQQPEPGEEE